MNVLKEKNYVQKYKAVFSPITIGTVAIPNRIFFPPICFNWARKDGTMSEKLHDFYMDLAMGGCGLIITGCAAVSPDSLLYERSMKVYDKSHIPGLKKLCEEIKQCGSVMGIQLMNFGRQSVTTYTGKAVYGPSAIPCPVKSGIDPGYKIREMTLEDIERVRNDFINAAILSAEAGIRFIQVHAAHGFLLNEFLSPYSNYRRDEYGGSVENRTRLIIEIVSGIRKELGNDVAIDIRLSINEFVPGGLEPEDFKEIIPLIEMAGVDMFNISGTVSETSGILFQQSFESDAPFVDVVQKMKEYTNLPIAHAASIRSIETVDKIISENKIDLAGMGRAQIADPSIVRKSAEGREAEIKKCIGDNECLFSFANREEGQLFCAVNPKYKRTKKKSAVLQVK